VTGLTVPLTDAVTEEAVRACALTDPSGQAVSEFEEPLAEPWPLATDHLPGL
jgi:hypothetical protein